MHMSALVIVPAEDADNVERAVAELLAPYNENSFDYECGEWAWWDWYVIGGRWAGEVLPNDKAPVKDAAEVGTYTVVSPEGYRHREYINPEWADNGYPPGVEPELPTPDFHQWRAEQMLKYRDGIAVIVDYHSSGAQHDERCRHHLQDG